MPCTVPDTEAQERRSEFSESALCYATQFLTDEQLSGFPGLLEWRRRHSFIDQKVESGFDWWEAANEYDEKNGFPDDHPGSVSPMFMKLWLDAVGWKEPKP